MIKRCAILLVIILAVAVHSQGRRCRRICQVGVPSPVVCAANHRHTECYRMTRCSLGEENCRRLNLRPARPTLHAVANRMCNNVNLSTGRGPCR